MAAELFGALVKGLRTVFVTRAELDRVNGSYPSMRDLVDRIGKLEDQLNVHAVVIAGINAPARVGARAVVDYSRGTLSR